MYSTLNTTNNYFPNPPFTTNSTTVVFKCELCDDYSNFYDYGTPDKHDYHSFCGKHKTEHDIRVMKKLRKSKLEKINEYNGNMGSL